MTRQDIEFVDFNEFLAALEGGDWRDKNYMGDRGFGASPRDWGANESLDGNVQRLIVSGFAADGSRVSLDWQGNMPLREAILAMEAKGVRFKCTPR